MNSTIFDKYLEIKRIVSEMNSSVDDDVDEEIARKCVELVLRSDKWVTDERFRMVLSEDTGLYVVEIEMDVNDEDEFYQWISERVGWYDMSLSPLGCGGYVAVFWFSPGGGEL